MRLIANMVARNEEPHYLKQVLNRLKDQVDDIIFTDDCSDDRTAEIAESVGCKVQQMPEPTFATNEGKLRQASWKFLENYADEETWVLAIDADEELYVTGHPLKVLIENTRYSVYDVEFYHMWNEAQYRVDKAWAPHGSTRFFRFMPGGHFKDRALACGSEPTYVHEMINRGLYHKNSGLKMKHLSYIKDEDKQKKYDRYSAIDGGKFHANAHIQSILDPVSNVILHDWKW
jgi:glycosyltransferase involved in cell wall biosynthesis